MAASPMTARFADGSALPLPRPNAETLRLLAERRSAKWAEIGSPGPTAAELRELIAYATRVPDHGKLAPWRFILMEGTAPAAFGNLLALMIERREPGAAAERGALERQRFAKVPAVAVLVSRAREQHKIPVWEQELSAGAVGMCFLIAANAMGFAAAWITEWFSYDSEVKSALGLQPGERIAGFIAVGSVGQITERTRPDASALITNWQP